MDSICRSVFLLQSWTSSFPIEEISAVTPTRSSLVSERFQVIQFHTTERSQKKNMQTNNVYFVSISKRVNIFGGSTRLSVSMFCLVSYEHKLCISDEIYSCSMDPMESIGTNFEPLLPLDDNFLSVLRTETPHVRWNLFVSDGIYSCPMDPMDSIGTTFDPLLPLDDNFLSVLRTETPHVRWNLFVSDGSDGLHRNDFRPRLTA